jgi:hypothetical protein
MISKEQLEKFIKEKKENIIIKEKTKIKKRELLKDKELLNELLIQMLIDFGYVEDDD